MTDAVRATVNRKELAALRAEASAAAGVETVEAVQLERWSLRDLFTAIFTFLGIYLVLGQLSNLSELGDALREANYWLIAGAFLAFTSVNIGYTAAYIGATPIRLPIGPTTALQYAGYFTDLVVPNGIGTTAINLRYLQLRGATLSAAAASSLVNTVASTIAQVIFIGTAVIVAGRSLHPDDIPWHGIVLVLVIAVVVLGAVAAIVWRLPRARTWIDGQARPALASLHEVLRSPAKLLLVVGGNLIVQTGFAACLYCAVAAYGDPLPFATIVLINVGVSTVSGLVPVPGSLGVAEAALASALTAAGLDETTAVAATLTHRFFTAYTSPIPGWIALQILERRGDL
jgi:uncharacterized membrane protein YbhN (UPF0104 family)